MIAFLKKRNSDSSFKWRTRIGIHSGPVVGGIVGTKKYLYDIFGDTVNTASRLETASEPMKITISEQTYGLTRDIFQFSSRGAVELRGKGSMELYFVES
jgi:class 3 adenylate cyclase